MARYGSRMLVPVDLKKKPWEQELPLHNRWHPDIPPVAEATTGELFRVEMIDFSGGAITKNYTAEDAKHVDLSAVSSLSIYTVCVFKYTCLITVFKVFSIFLKLLITD